MKVVAYLQTVQQSGHWHNLSTVVLSQWERLSSFCLFVATPDKWVWELHYNEKQQVPPYRHVFSIMVVHLEWHIFRAYIRFPIPVEPSQQCQQLPCVLMYPIPDNRQLKLSLYENQYLLWLKCRVNLLCGQIVVLFWILQLFLWDTFPCYDILGVDTGNCSTSAIHQGSFGAPPDSCILFVSRLCQKNSSLTVLLKRSAKPFVLGVAIRVFRCLIPLSSR